MTPAYLTPAQRDTLDQWLRALGRGLTHDGQRLTTVEAAGRERSFIIERDAHFGGLYVRSGNASIRLDE